DHVLHRRIRGRGRVGEVRRCPDCLSCKVPLARARRRRRRAVVPDARIDAARVSSVRNGGAASDRATRDTLAVLGDAAQPLAAADRAVEALEDAYLTRRVVVPVRAPLGAPGDEVDLGCGFDADATDAAPVSEVVRACGS